MNETWAINLKTAFEAGYYRTESADAEQTPFPWQNKTCADCPFWLNNVCRVHAGPRDPEQHTCSYFDAAHRQEAQRIIDTRMQAVRKMWRGRLGR